MTVFYDYAVKLIKSSDDRAVSWRESMEHCEMYFDSYLFGDLPLGSRKKMCKTIGVELSGPTWIGIATQIYISADQGNISCIRLSYKYFDINL
ncbi:hypothetical protein MHBO_004200 [Bonamia ostreae]|uniref:Uncharacterized protein n=1 Tax=Bonamia ostreae TaxID=126728 RepID=A0ABV2ASN4_9EUKA